MEAANVDGCLKTPFACGLVKLVIRERRASATTEVEVGAIVHLRLDKRARPRLDDVPFVKCVAALQDPLDAVFPCGCHPADQEANCTNLHQQTGFCCLTGEHDAVKREVQQPTNHFGRKTSTVRQDKIGWREHSKVVENDVLLTGRVGDYKIKTDLFVVAQKQERGIRNRIRRVTGRNLRRLLNGLYCG